MWELAKSNINLIHYKIVKKLIPLSLSINSDNEYFIIFFLKNHLNSTLNL